MLDTSKTTKTVKSLVPALLAATTKGSGVDTAGFDSATIVIASGVLTDGTHTFEVQESVDDVDGDYTAVADADMVDGDGDGTIEPVLATTDDNVVREIGYKGSKQWIRVVDTVSGSPSTGGVVAALVILGHGRKKPV